MKGEIRLFGTFEVYVDGLLKEVRGQKNQALLASVTLCRCAALNATTSTHTTSLANLMRSPWVTRRASPTSRRSAASA